MVSMLTAGLMATRHTASAKTVGLSIPVTLQPVAWILTNVIRYMVLLAVAASMQHARILWEALLAHAHLASLVIRTPSVWT